MTELTLASVFWGFGFPGTIWALQFLCFPAVIFYRFFGAFLAGTLVLLLLSRARPDWRGLKHEFILARGGGFWLGATLVLQTWGLLTTSATKSAFLTVLYVIFVPLLGAIFDRERLSVRNTFCLILALVGTALIVKLDSFSLSRGDALTLGNAVTAACHIRLMGRLAPLSKDHFAFNVFQCLWTALFTLPVAVLALAHPALFDHGWNLGSLDTHGWIGLTSLTLGSSLFAFFLQVRAQKHLSASVAALLFLMESPFAAFFGAGLLGERLGLWQLLGAILIFGACLAASLPKKFAPGAHT